MRDVPRMENGVIVFSTRFRDQAGITFAKVERAAFRPTVRVIGDISLNPSHVAALGTRIRGTVRRTFKYEGDHVEANEPLAEIESAELGEAQSTIAQAKASFGAAEIQAKREAELLERGLTTAREAEVATSELAQQRASLQAAQQRVKAFGGSGAFGVYIVRSPIAGHVVQRGLAPGQTVDGTGIAYRIADLQHFWIELTVFERDIEVVRLGDDVEVSPLSAPKVKLVGKIAHVGELVDPATRSIDVRVTVDNPPAHLRPGQSVQATITSSTVERDALLVPQAAVVYVDGRATVFVAEGDTRVRAVTVKLGSTDGTSHEILEGLNPGQLVANAGVFALKSELFR